MAEVSFNNVWKIYDKSVEAVKDLSFCCKDREFFAILGPSGCGKSSSLRMLAGLEEISRGDVFIKGRRVNDLSSRERNVAMSFENYGLYPDFTVYDNIAYPLKIHKVKPDEIKKQVLDIAKRLRLTDVLNYKPSALSSGQKQRVSIARALVRNPDVTIMDEPLSHLDAKMRSHMRSVIKRLHNNMGLTTVYVTHDQIEAMTMADKILIMDGGYAQQIGTPDEVYSEPANLFVAGFIGTPQMNLLSGVVNDGGDVFVCPDAFDLPMPAYAGKVAAGQAVTLGIRPHDIEVFSEPVEGAVQGSVYVVELLGETTIISIRVGGNVLKVEVEGLQTGWNFDDTVYFRIHAVKAHLFDNESTLRIVPLGAEL